MLDWILLSNCILFDKKYMVIICSSCHTVYSWRDFRDIGDPGFFQQSFLADSVLKRLNLYKDELALLKALSIFSPGRFIVVDR